jgi:hypothetical protein
VADAPWRCSQCGTVNEPVANACRTCGRWPSLFEIEGSTIETEPPTVAEDRFPAETVEVEEPEPETFEPEAMPDSELPPEFEGDEDEERPERSRWQVLARLIVPLGVVIYILITALVDR